MGKAQEAYIVLSKPEQRDDVIVKEVVFKAYNLFPEVYRRWFRWWRKGEKQTQFARESTIHFNRWCVISGTLKKHD